MQALGSAYRWLQDRSRVPLPRFPAIYIKKQGVREKVVPTREHVLRVLEEMDGWTRMAVTLLYATGARPAEIRDLTWGKVDWERAELTLDGKTGVRTVPLASDALQALSNWLSLPERTPSSTVLPVTRSTFNSYLGPRALRRACIAAGVPVFPPYGLRRAAVNAMIRAGVDLKTAASITGHSITVMLKYYRTVTSEDRRRAIEVAALGSLNPPKVVPFRRPARPEIAHK